MWKQCLHMVFAEGNNPSVTRKTVAALLESVRITRNRVAHQNYMKSFDVPKAMSDVFAVADLISPMYGEWMRQHSQWRGLFLAVLRGTFIGTNRFMYVVRADSSVT